MAGGPPTRTLAVVLVVVLAGCGGVASDAPETSTAAPTASQEATTTGASTTDLGTPNGTLSVHFINVGQGSSTLVVGPTGETMLIDTGDWRADGEGVLAYLEARDVDRIDYLVTTHADADHVGGHAAVIEHFETEAEGVGAVYDPGIASSSQTYAAYLDAVEAHDVTLYETRAGDRIPLEGAAARVLAPPAGYLADRDRNENSLVLALEFGQSRFLLPGDGERESEEYLVERYGDALNATVLGAGHHGSRSSSTGEFLDAVSPRLVVVSSAYDSQYGHPHEEALRRLADRSVRTYWTGTHGTVVLTSDGSAVTVATQYRAPTDPLELRDADPADPESATPVEARTVVPVGESTPTTLTPDGGTTTQAAAETTEASDALAVAAIHADAEGNDNDHLNDEYVVFENTGGQPLDLGGWTVRDAAGHAYTFPSGFALDAGARVTLHTGSGEDSATDLYWGEDRAVWNNDGDTVVVETDAGTTVIERTYG
ncbi:lamin tail domain-containing protein [Halobacterium yunchengense]|uniref:lamin tail domain-containing protein n=1 Tax=Halobacterium yunchengense TaxID=3108497 RepID=UPI0030099CE3